MSLVRQMPVPLPTMSSFQVSLRETIVKSTGFESQETQWVNIDWHICFSIGHMLFQLTSEHWHMSTKIVTLALPPYKRSPESVLPHCFSLLHGRVSVQQDELKKTEDCRRQKTMSYTNSRHDKCFSHPSFLQPRCRRSWKNSCHWPCRSCYDRASGT